MGLYVGKYDGTNKRLSEKKEKELRVHIVEVTRKEMGGHGWVGRFMHKLFNSIIPNHKEGIDRRLSYLDRHTNNLPELEKDENGDYLQALHEVLNRPSIPRMPQPTRRKG